MWPNLLKALSHVLDLEILPNWLDMKTHQVVGLGLPQHVSSMSHIGISPTLSDLVHYHLTGVSWLSVGMLSMHLHLYNIFLLIRRLKVLNWINLICWDGERLELRWGAFFLFGCLSVQLQSISELARWRSPAKL